MPPAPHEVEVSIFGPGHGECVVIHLGNREWIVVDSCRDYRDGQPAALNYFDQIGVDPASAVKMVLATHWHDDHIRGLAAVVERCRSSRFVCSGAIKSEEFLKLAFSYANLARLQNATGVDEITRIVNALRTIRSVNPHAGPHFAQESTKLFSSGNVVVEALSPSSGSITLAQAELAKLMPHVGALPKKLRPIEPNDASVAIWIEAFGIRILLGADLEERNDPTLGWQAVVSAPLRPAGTASVFKIPHHGSTNGHHGPVWQTMLESDAWAITTPFVRSKLPGEGDVRRLKSHTSRLYLTAPSKSRAIKRSETVQKMLKQFAPSLRSVDTSFGQVRLRRCFAPVLESDWRVEVLGEAYRL